MDNIQRYIERTAVAELAASISRNPVTALVGPRQCGKSTLVRRFIATREDALFLDLQSPADLRKLDDAELFLGTRSDRLVCIDEIQLRPELFGVLRSLVDRDRRPGRFILLGSASRDLVRQGGESLAGRIHYIELTPFRLAELAGFPDRLRRLWWRGGFPPAFLGRGDGPAREWIDDLIRDYLMRDVPALGFSIPAATLGRFLRMLAHYHGQVFNASKLGQSLDLSHNTARRYLDLLEQTFLIRRLAPLEINLKKRLVKAPKIYFRDTGLLHAVHEIPGPDALFAHPVFGASWEGLCIEEISRTLPEWRPAFYRTASGEEIDLILERGRRRLAFEFKASLSPKLSRGFPATIEAIAPERTFVVIPMEAGEGYPLRPGVHVCGLDEMLGAIAADFR